MSTKRSYRLRPGHALVLRVCDAERRSYGGFQWPESGPVAAPDWDPTPECGHGLHGWLWGEGDGIIADLSSPIWMVVDVLVSAIVDLGGKVKFPRGTVVFSGDREEATAWLALRAPGRAIIGGTSTSGDRGTSTSGDGGTSTSGDRGTSTSGEYGTLVIKWYDRQAQRYRLRVGYIGEDGLEPGVRYRLDDAHNFVRVGEKA